MPLRKKISLSTLCKCLSRRVGYVFQMITLAGDIGIFQHHYFTPGEQGGKKQYHYKAEINDMTRPQAACEFFNQLWFSIFVSCCTLTTPHLLL